MSGTVVDIKESDSVTAVLDSSTDTMKKFQPQVRLYKNRVAVLKSAARVYVNDKFVGTVGIYEIGGRVYCKMDFTTQTARQEKRIWQVVTTKYAY